MGNLVGLNVGAPVASEGAFVGLQEAVPSVGASVGELVKLVGVFEGLPVFVVGVFDGLNEGGDKEGDLVGDFVLVVGELEGADVSPSIVGALEGA